MSRRQHGDGQHAAGVRVSTREVPSTLSATMDATSIGLSVAISLTVDAILLPDALPVARETVRPAADAVSLRNVRTSNSSQRS